MYADRSFKTKKALREAVSAGQEIGIFQPGPFGGNEPKNGTTSIEGPNYEMHTWYATVTLVDGLITKVK